jgi:tRNA-Thr(GGU) m(6)t(6)A37 methyltransferase TsaA
MTDGDARDAYTIHPIGFVRSTLQALRDAPRQGREGAPDAWVEIVPDFAPALRRIAVGDELVLITWLHLAQRDVLEVHPRDERTNPLTGVFVTRSSDRPNPLGLHRVSLRAIEGTRLLVGPLEAIDGTPVIDVKVALREE